MTMPEPGRPNADKPEYTTEDVRWSRAQRRREKIRTEIERNRQGGHRVPTWALALLLLAVIGAWVLLVFVG